MSKTPLTDALLNTTYIGDGTHFVDFARKLETDRAELVEALKRSVAHLPLHTRYDKNLVIELNALLARLEADK